MCSVERVYNKLKIIILVFLLKKLKKLIEFLYRSICFYWIKRSRVL